MLFGKQRGFTLIELLIALAILGVVAALSLPAYRGYILSTRQNVADANRDTLRVAEEAYFFENNAYIAGTYDPANGIDTLRTPLGWRPDGDDSQLRYVVDPCPAPRDTLTNCYRITVSGFTPAVQSVYMSP